MTLNQTISHIRTPLAIASSLLIFTFISHAAYAQTTYQNVALDTTNTDSNKMGISLGINVMADGSPYDMDDNIKILPSLFFDNGKVYARGSQLGGYLINNDKNEVAAFIQPSGYDFDPDDANGAFKGLNEREVSGVVGVSYLRRTPVGGFRARIAADVLDNSDGTVAQLAYLARLTTGNLTVYPSIGVEWADDTYNDYYYGVSAKESAKTGINSYKADASFSPYINVSANYDINKDWALFLSQNVGYLADEQADSPMVDDRTTYRTTIGLLYNF